MARRLTLLALTGMLAVASLVSPAGAANGPTPVVLDLRGPAGSLPVGFLGMAVEASSMGSSAYDPAVSNLDEQLVALGPGVLSFAGSSADRSTAWQRRPSDLIPRWATATVTPDKLRTLAALASATGWRIDLGVNLYHDDPAAAADEVAAARRILGASLRNVHLGNEPELYTYMYPVPMSFDQYAQRWASYRKAIVARVPDVRFTGPDTYLPIWYDQLLAARKVSGALGEVGDHFYPFSDCANAGVSAAQLLSDRSLAKETKAIAKDAALAGPLGIPISFDELNSVSCGSSAPVQWQGASALWAVRALLTAASGGVSSVGVQANLQRCHTYSPLCPEDQGAPNVQSPTPIMAALRLVAGLEGGTFLRLRTTSGALPAGASAWALTMPGGAKRVVVANTSAADLVDVSITGGPTAFSSRTTMAVADVTSTDLPVVTSESLLAVSPQHLTVPAQSVVVLGG